MLHRLWAYERSDNLFFIARRRANAKTAIIFLHGLGSSHNYWDAEYNALSSDSLYFVDLLGFGFSKKPDENYTLAVHVNALEKFISKNVKEKSIIFIGHSLGAMLSLAYASIHPTSIKKLILLSLPFYRSEGQATEAINKFRSLSFLFADTPLAHLSCSFVCTFRPAFRIFAPFFIKDFPKKVVQDSFLHMHASYFSTLRNVILQQNITPLFTKQLNKKIVLIHARQDNVVPIKNIETLAKKFSLKLITLPEEDHNFPLLSSKKLVKILRKLI